MENSHANAYRFDIKELERLVDVGGNAASVRHLTDDPAYLPGWAGDSTSRTLK